MRLLPLLPILLLAGCGYTRAEYEQANGLPILATHALTEGKYAGATMVVYGPDKDPRIDPAAGDYSCPEGVRVAIYRDGVLVARWFQEHEKMRSSRVVE
jgi:hypothetical protein